MTEIWKSIEGYETYSVSTFGNVKNDTTGMILKGCSNGIGHLRVELWNNIGKKEYIHRLIALAFIPNFENKEFVDHIDNNPLNNNLTNLRWVSKNENAMNSKIPSNNTSGIKGVYWYKSRHKWCAEIKFNCKKIVIGYYDTIEDATLARQTRANELFGSFTNSCEKL